MEEMEKKCFWYGRIGATMESLVYKYGKNGVWYGRNGAKYFWYGRIGAFLWSENLFFIFVP